MAKLKIIIHPLFFAFGIYFALIGKVFSFLIFVLTALIHEFGHYIASSNCGYSLNRIVLMPYGAMISGDIDDIKYRDEIEIAFFGPLFNFLIVILFVALWWVEPEIYAYTDEIVSANLLIASINLLPCFPLDGGRILKATLSLYFSRKTADRVCRIVGVVCSFVILTMFVISIFSSVNFSILFFASFMFFGAVSKSKENQYVRIYSDLAERKFKRGQQIKKVAIFGSSTVKSLYRLIGSDVCEVAVLNENGKEKATIPFFKVNLFLQNCLLYDTIDEALKFFEKSN